MASGAHQGKSQEARRVYFWRAPPDDPRHHHRNLATETKCVMGTMRTVEGQAYTAPLPPYLRPDHPAAWSFCQGCCRLIGEFRADGSQALRCLDSGKTGEANKDSAGSFYGQAKTKSHQHAKPPLRRRARIR